jgi:hypothetical protein
MDLKLAKDTERRWVDGVGIVIFDRFFVAFTDGPPECLGSFLRLRHDNTIVALLRVLPNLDNLESRLLQELVPLIHRPLNRSKCRQHGHVELGCAPRGAFLGQHHVVDEDD